MSEQRGNFTIVPNELLDAKISTAAKLAYVVLLRYADNSGECFPGVGTIAKGMSCTIPTARKAVDELEAAGLVESKQRNKGKRAARSNLYRLGRKNLSTCGDEVEKIFPPGRKNLSTEVEKIFPLIRPNEKDSVKRTDYPQDFEAFWKEYPRRKEKRDTLKAWRKALKEGATPEQLTKAAAGYAKHCRQQGTAEQYTKHGARFLNSGAWEDYLTGPEEPPDNQGSTYLAEMRKARKRREIHEQ